ncbi:MAG: hypothetical protein Q7R66_08380 [Undibacterium sp.]|uniref:hypothetical protein n=1 Tax=Undibacterium sp. TaxID=1914977 RepID=UPI00271F84C4|nr:hypothetical protein [Undibacterium sp.]MDO8652190.1 hypothetical protein [Undibacterium sp.]
MKNVYLFLLSMFAISSAHALDCPIGQKKYYIAYQTMTANPPVGIGSTYFCGDTQQTKTEEGLNQIERHIRTQAKGLDKATIVITNIIPLDR